MTLKVMIQPHMAYKYEGEQHMDYKEVFGEIGTQIEAVVKEKGLHLIVDNKEKPEYIPKSRLDEIIGSKNELRTQVGELTNQLELLKKSAKGNDELVKTIDELQKKNVESELKYKKNILESTIKNKAILEKAKDANDLLKFLDVSKFEIDDSGNVQGLDEQITALKESKSYLFEVVANNATTSTSVNPPSHNTNELDNLMAQIRNNPNDRNLVQKLFLLKENRRK